VLLGTLCVAALTSQVLIARKQVVPVSANITYVGDVQSRPPADS
jgi:hypothetical protein